MLGVCAKTFYDPKQIALLAMGFCYQQSGKLGDLPPRVECVEKWPAKLLQQLQLAQWLRPRFYRCPTPPRGAISGCVV